MQQVEGEEDELVMARRCHRPVQRAEVGSSGLVWQHKLAIEDGRAARIVKRANDGRKAAKARGARFGRNPKLDAHQQKEALRRLQAGESARALGRSYKVHHATISRLRAV